MEQREGFIFEAPKGKVVLNQSGLSKSEIDTLNKMAKQLFERVKNESRYSLDRCTFFAEPGCKILSEIIKDNSLLTNPRIEGNDKNPFDQHYWVAADLEKDGKKETIIFDPIFGYVGLQKKASKTIGELARYYRRKRTVPYGTPYGEGGVRIKTMSI